MVFLTPAFYWYARSHLSESDRITVGTVLASVELAYVIALGLLSLRRESASGFAAGFSFGAAGLVLGGALLWVALEEGFGNHGDAAFHAVFNLYKIASVAVLIVAIVARGRIAWFVLGVAGAPAGLALIGAAINPVFSVPQQNYDQLRTKARIQEMDASRAVFGLTACIMRAHETNGAFPAVLPDSGTNAGCNGARNVPGYTLIYKAGDPPDNFLLLAKPDSSTIDDRAGAVMSDNRGIVFVDHDFPKTSKRTDRGTYVSGSNNGLGFIYGVRNAVRGFMQKHDSLTAPKSLDAIAAADPNAYTARYFTEIAGDTAYRVEYGPLSAGAPAAFAISATCKDYGVRCMRSYRMSGDGRVHATGAPRPATDADPLMLDRENSDGAVNSGIVWRKQ